jgi:hypothetical protein
MEFLVIPKAGHWIGDENPLFTAARIWRLFEEGNGAVELSCPAL